MNSSYVFVLTSSDNMKTVLKIVDKPAPIETPASTNNSNNYILTESSSSGMIYHLAAALFTYFVVIISVLPILPCRFYDG